MTDVFSTHTSDSCVWWVFCVLVIRVVKMLSLSLNAEEMSFSSQITKRKKIKTNKQKKQDDVKKRHVVILGFVFVGAYPHTDAKKGVRPGNSLCTDRWDWEINTTVWGCSMNVNDITTVLIKEKCCLGKLTKVTFTLKTISDRAPNTDCFHYCFIFHLFFKWIKNEVTFIEKLKNKGSQSLKWLLQIACFVRLTVQIKINLHFAI